MDNEFVSGQSVDYDLDCFYWEVCCDCQLAHYVIYTTKGKKLAKRIYRDEWKTRQWRNQMSDDDLHNVLSILQAERRRRKKK